jgi:hypothetical protein
MADKADKKSKRREDMALGLSDSALMEVMLRALFLAFFSGEKAEAALRSRAKINWSN